MRPIARRRGRDERQTPRGAGHDAAGAGSLVGIDAIPQHPTGGASDPSGQAHRTAVETRRGDPGEARHEERPGRPGRRARVLACGLEAPTVDALRLAVEESADVAAIDVADLLPAPLSPAPAVVVLGPAVGDPSAVAATLLARHRSLAVVVAAHLSDLPPAGERVLLGGALSWVASERPVEVEAAVRSALDARAPGPSPRAAGDTPRDPLAAVGRDMAAALASDPTVCLYDRLAAATEALAAALGPAGVWLPAGDQLALVTWAGVSDATTGSDAASLPGALPLAWLDDPSPGARAELGVVAFPLVPDRRALAYLGVAVGRRRAADIVPLVDRLAAELTRDLRRELRHGRAVARADAWRRLTAELAAAGSAEEVAEVVTEHAPATIDAAGCALGFARPGRAVQRIGDPRLGPVRSSYDDALPLAQVLRTGRVVAAVTPDAIAERFPALVPCDGDTLASVIAAPVRARRGGDAAALAFGWPTARRFGPTGLSELATLAELCSLSLERARLAEVEAREQRASKEAVDRLRRLQRAAAALSAPLPFPAAARAVLREAVGLLGARGGVVAVARTPDGDLELLARSGTVPAEGPWRTDPATGTPTALLEGWRAGQPVFPDRKTGRDLCVLPLSWEGQPLGVVGVALDPAPGPEEAGDGFDERQRLVALTFAEQAGQVLERARLHDLDVRARHRAAQLAAASDALAATLSVHEAVEVTARAAASLVGADGAAVLLRDEHDADLVRTVATADVPPERAELFQRFRLRAASPLGEAIRRRRPDGASSLEEGVARWPLYADAIRQSGYAAWQVVPLEQSDEVVGGVVVGFDRPHHADPEEIAALSGLASRCAQAIFRARRESLEHEVALTLQRSLLTKDLPLLPGVRVASRYVPAKPGREAGGDWYDVVDLGGGRVCLLVGDVVGGGLGAALAMGQLRSAARGLLVTGCGPAALLEGLDRYVAGAPRATAASVACLTLDTERGELRYALAGHPPPLVRDRTGVRALDVPGSPPLGEATGPRLEGAMALAPGSTVVLYTDGLVQRPDEPLSAGVARLKATLAGLTGDALDAPGDELVAKSGAAGELDDLVALCASYDAPRARAHLQRFPNALDQLPAARRSLRLWLDSLDLDADVAADVLLATSEALNNAFEHAHGSSLVTVRAHLSDGELVVRVTDEGRWQSGPPVPTKGQGLPIMRSLVDAVEVRRDESGTTILLRRRV